MNRDKDRKRAKKLRDREREKVERGAEKSRKSNESSERVYVNKHR